jgi:molybdopterin converting factor small subunit
MIQINLTYASLSRELDVNGTTVGDVRTQYEDIYSLPENATVTVNGYEANDDTVIRNGDSVKFASPVAGAKG